jgi:hypothetical protein
MRVAGLRRVLAPFVALAAVGVLPGVAAAGEYHVYSCRTPEGAVAPTEGWSEGSHSGEDTTLNTCSSGGGLIAGLNAHVSHAADTDKATWGFEAPVGETISEATLMRAGETAPLTKPETAYVFWLAGIADSGPETQVIEECGAKKCPDEGVFTDPLAAENRVVVPESALGSRYLYLNVSCSSLVAACAAAEPGKVGYAATVELFAADLVLSQTENPKVSGVSGALAEATTVSGTSDVSFDASDPGSGVYEVVFRVDGQVVSTVVPEEEGGRCHNVGGTTDGLPAFLYAKPCPAAISVDLPFDTTTLSNGTHHLLVTVLDAAGNSQTVLDREVSVDNATPGGSGKGSGTGEGEAGSGSGGGSNTGGSGENGSGTGGSGSGSSGSGSDGSGTGANGSGTGAGGAGTGSTGSMGASAGAGGATASTAALGPANGTNAAEDATLTASWADHPAELLHSAYGAAHTVQGRLTAPGGAPIAGAQLEVQELPAYQGAPPRTLAAPRTGAQGRWSLQLPRSISSAQLRFVYRSHLDASLPAATRTLTLSVRAGLQLTVAPRVAAVRGEIRFAGRVLGGPVPAGGKQLVLEALAPGARWQEFHVIRAAAGGRFRFAYRFRLPGPIGYRFRVRCEAEADYPFAAGSSNVVRVYER